MCLHTARAARPFLMARLCLCRGPQLQQHCHRQTNSSFSFPKQTVITIKAESRSQIIQWLRVTPYASFKECLKKKTKKKTVEMIKSPRNVLRSRGRNATNASGISEKEKPQISSSKRNESQKLPSVAATSALGLRRADMTVGHPAGENIAI